MFKKMIITTLFGLTSSMCFAQTVDQLRQSPKQFLNKDVEIKQINCAEIDLSITCMKPVGGGFIKLFNGQMNILTNNKVYDYFYKECKGSGNINRKKCVFNIKTTFGNGWNSEIKTEQGVFPVTTFSAKLIEFKR